MLRQEKLTINGHPFHTMLCDSVLNLVAVEKAKVPAVNRENRRQNASLEFSLDYNGLTCLADARNLIENGWPEGATRVRRLAESVESSVPTPVSIRRKPRYEDQGDELSTDRLYSGQLDTCWRTMRREAMPAASHVDVLIHWGALRSTSAEEMFWQGACGLAVIDLLESAGYRVSARAVNYTPRGYRNRGEGTITGVTVKEYDSPVRLDALASITAHAGIYRTYGFMLKDLAPFDVEGCGSSEEINAAALAYISDAGVKTLVLPKAYSETAAIAAIRQALREMKGDQTDVNAQRR